MGLIVDISLFDRLMIFFIFIITIVFTLEGKVGRYEVYSQGFRIAQHLFDKLRLKREFFLFKDIATIGYNEDDLVYPERNMQRGFVVLCHDGYRYIVPRDALLLREMKGTLEAVKREKGLEWWLVHFDNEYYDVSEARFMERKRFLTHTYAERSKRNVTIGWAVGLTVFALLLGNLLYDPRIEKLNGLIMLSFVTYLFVRMLPRGLAFRYTAFGQEFERYRLKVARKIKSPIPSEVLELERQLNQRLGDEVPRIFQEPVFVSQPGAQCEGCQETFQTDLAVFAGQSKARIYCPHCDHKQLMDVNSALVHDAIDKELDEHIDRLIMEQHLKSAKQRHLMAPRKLWKRGASQCSIADREKVQRKLRIKTRHYVLAVILLLVALALTEDRTPRLSEDMEKLLSLVLTLGIFYFGWRKYSTDVDYEQLYGRLLENGKLNQVQLVPPDKDNIFTAEYEEQSEKREREAKIQRSITDQLFEGNWAEAEIDGIQGFGTRMAPEMMIKASGYAGNGLGAFCAGGKIVLEGDAGDGVGREMEDGLIVIHGSVGFRCGGRMKGGTIIVTDECGDQAGEIMLGGRVLVGGAIKSVGNNAVIEDLEEEDIECLVENGVDSVEATRFTKLIAGPERDLDRLIQMSKEAFQVYKMNKKESNEEPLAENGKG